MRLSSKLSLALVAVFAVFMLVANPGNLLRREKQRDCGENVRPRAVNAWGSWGVKIGQSASYVAITGNIGPMVINEPRVRNSPAHFRAQACPGETAAITFEALNGPLPTILCNISVGGTNLTGDLIQRNNAPGYRAGCAAVIR